jgi:hypothetical protein
VNYARSIPEYGRRIKMNKMDIEKEQSLDVLRKELVCLYKAYDDENRPIPKQDFKRLINYVENRIAELQRRARYLKG